MMTREESAESYGYQRGSCPRCHRTVWSDTPVFECVCGCNNLPEEVEEEEERDGNAATS
jgi:hypothetical protein